jgi:hypothetical protein
MPRHLIENSKFEFVEGFRKSLKSELAKRGASRWQRRQIDKFLFKKLKVPTELAAAVRNSLDQVHAQLRDTHPLPKRFYEEHILEGLITGRVNEREALSVLSEGYADPGTLRRMVARSWIP